ncbi:DUF4215 domain-containing protein [Candidatus Woesearchaeota archaeon]|nr:DUF4215 domain-containing protein [Candidatus Woesearchaeota archaeon]
MKNLLNVVALVAVLMVLAAFVGCSTGKDTNSAGLDSFSGKITSTSISSSSRISSFPAATSSDRNSAVRQRISSNDQGRKDLSQTAAGSSAPASGLPIRPVCGDGILESGEQCDDRNIVSGDGCSSSCSIIESGWTCSAGNPCTPICGDAIVVSYERCDDGNTNSNDGCAGNCLNIEHGWRCQRGTSCTPVCGDSIIRGTETCDDGGVVRGDGCSPLCQIEGCGDGFYDPNGTNNILGDSDDEQCDDGNTDNRDGCNTACKNVRTTG